MKFLVDAQLPRRLAHRLRAVGYDVLHTLDLPRRNRTPDAEINALAQQDERIVITKDADFVNTFVVAHKPYKLLLVSTGNTNNADLEALFLTNIAQITTAFLTYDFVELTRSGIIVHS